MYKNWPLLFSLAVGALLFPTALFSSHDIHILQIVHAASSSRHEHSHHHHDKIPSHSIAVCCAWNSKILDGILTYKIIGGNMMSKQAVKDSMKAWEAKIKAIKFVEISEKKKEKSLAASDIIINFRKDGGKTAGQTTNSFDNYGFTNTVSITLSRGAYGNHFNNAEIEKVATHEIGHVLGIGHANFNNDLMSVMVNDESEDISHCDVNAVLQANQWKLLTSDAVPRSPEVKYVKC